MGNALIVDQVDKGLMAYVLSTPTKRSAVALTQAIFMIFVPLLVVAIVFYIAGFMKFKTKDLPL